MKPISLDDIDRQILNLLSENARIPNTEIAKQLEMVPSGILKRIRNLEDAGVIEGYETRISHKKLELGLTSFVWVNSDEALGEIDAGHEIAKLPEVQEVHCMAGDYWYLLKVRVADTDAHMALIKKLGRIDGIRDCRSTMVLNTIKETLALDIS